MSEVATVEQEVLRAVFGVPAPRERVFPVRIRARGRCSCGCVPWFCVILVNDRGERVMVGMQPAMLALLPPSGSA